MRDRRKESQGAIRPTAWNDHRDIEVGKDIHGIDAAGNDEHEGEANIENSMEGDAADESLRPEEPSVFQPETAEALAPRGMRASSMLSAAAREYHELTHCPARSWCEHCVRRQYKDTLHKSIQGVYADLTVV